MATVSNHDLFCYKSAFSCDGTQLATCGADGKMNQYDLRNTKKPVWSIQVTDKVLMCCDWFNDDLYLICSSIEGEIFMYSTELQK